MIQAIIFDAGNVIVGFDLLRMCRTLAHYSPLKPDEIFCRIFEGSIMKGYEEGHMGTLAFYEAVKGSIFAYSSLTLDLFCSIWQDIFTPNPIIEIVLMRLHPELNFVILSNTNELHWNYVTNLPIMKRFFSDEEKLILSFRHGSRKPETQFFIEAIKRCGCAAHEIVYIDDIAEYIEIFTELGGNGIVYNCQIHTPEYLIHALSAYGVITNCGTQ